MSTIGQNILFSDERLSLYIDTIKALECLKYWFRAGVFIQDDLSQGLHEQPQKMQVHPYVILFKYLHRVLEI